MALLVRLPIPPADKATLLGIESTLSHPRVGSDDRMRLIQMAYELGRSQGRVEGSKETGDAMMKSFDKAVG